ncbi:DUF2169 family type VI secretion system accessory protein [Martelella soudanensis]|uniref:DUF2169 family type VI secretion system accessory protein n=1 Tax=unclassified Martelella TaxID=2629616 RepID=UPI0015DFED71|nr:MULTISPECIES: DUF2169 domain-containing protein [unclassified Martelella]
MLDRNTTGFAAIGFEQTHRDGGPMGVVAVRGCYDLSADGSLTLAPTQELVLADEYEGDPQARPLIRCSDLVPFRPKADITVLTRTYPRAADTATGWKTGVKLGDHAYVIDVTGDRRWSFSESGGWQLAPPNSLSRTLVDYRIAASDTVEGAPPDDSIPDNPLGARRLEARYLDQEKTWPHPMLFSASDTQGREAMDARHEVAGFAPVPPFWRLRQQYAGTYGKAWLENRHPRLPEDFDYAFYQYANPRLIYPGYLKGDEEVFLAAVLPGGRNLVFNLPGVRPVAHYQWIDDREVFVRLNCDGVHVDTREEPFTVAITWRAWLPVCPQFFKIDLFAGSLDEARTYPVSTLHGLEGTEEPEAAVASGEQSEAGGAT